LRLVVKKINNVLCSKLTTVYLQVGGLKFLVIGQYFKISNFPCIGLLWYLCRSVIWRRYWVFSKGQL